MKPTGSPYYLLAVSDTYGNSNRFILINYLTCSTTNWLASTSELVNPTYFSLTEPLPTLDAIRTTYADAGGYTLVALVPLTSPTSALSDYPELFL